MPALSAKSVLAYAVVTLVAGTLTIAFLRSVGPAVTAEAQRAKLLACAPLIPATENPVVGPFPSSAPAFTVKDAQGQEVSLSSLRGKVVLLNFWATWCPPCVEEMPSMERLATQLANRPDFAVVPVSMDDQQAAVAAFVNKSFPQGSHMTLWWDPTKSVAGRFGTSQFPETFLIDREGLIRYYFINQRDWSSGRAQRCIESVLNEG
jgi:peroxiredoxin